MASIDVCIPNYNYARYLGDCIRSIQAQGVDALRILVIDNASTDDSVAVARRFAAEDPRIEVRARPVNLGPHASFNEGVDWAAADYFMLTWADDLVAPGSLTRAMALMERQSEVNFTIGQSLSFRDGETPPAPDPADAAPSWHILTGPEFIADRCRTLSADQIIVRTAAQKRAGHYRPELYFTDDFEMLLRLAALGSAAMTSAAQSYRRMHGSNLCDLHKVDRARDLREFEAAFNSFFAREGRQLAEAERLSAFARRNLVDTAYWWGVRELTHGRARNGLRLLRFAFERSPRTAVMPPLSYLWREGRPLHRLLRSARRAITARGMLGGRNPRLPGYSP
jgi:glycosyltransferase involved in cell wall biosynthesis